MGIWIKSSRTIKAHEVFKDDILYSLVGCGTRANKAWRSCGGHPWKPLISEKQVWCSCFYPLFHFWYALISCNIPYLSVVAEKQRWGQWAKQQMLVFLGSALFQWESAFWFQQPRYCTWRSISRRKNWYKIWSRYVYSC